MSRSLTKMKSVKTVKEAGTTQNTSLLHPAADMIGRPFSFAWCFNIGIPSVFSNADRES